MISMYLQAASAACGEFGSKETGWAAETRPFVFSAPRKAQEPIFGEGASNAVAAFWRRSFMDRDSRIGREGSSLFMRLLRLCVILIARDMNY